MSKKKKKKKKKKKSFDTENKQDKNYVGTYYQQRMEDKTNEQDFVHYNTSDLQGGSSHV